MKILFSFECGRMPLRATTLINWLISRGHKVDVLYDQRIAHDDIEGVHYLKNATIYKSAPTVMAKISSIPQSQIIRSLNDYDIWFADLLNHKDYHSKSHYNSYFRSFKNLLCIVSFDDGNDYFTHRLDEDIFPKVGCFINNLVFKDMSVYDSEIQKRNMLMPTYIEASNEAYDEYTNIHGKTIRPYMEKADFIYFSGAVTGCFPGVECRVNSINHASRCGVSYNIRVTGTDTTPFLKYFYDNCIDPVFKKPAVDRLTFLNELDTHKIILSPKGNCQPVRRQYEGFAFNTLVFINENNTFDYLYEGTPNVHFVQYKLDCSDLKEKLRYYHNNPTEAQKIADAGTKFWNDNCRVYSDGSISKNLENTLLNNFKSVTGVDL
jgi:hypothetical protein